MTYFNPKTQEDRAIASWQRRIVLAGNAVLRLSSEEHVEGMKQYRALLNSVPRHIWLNQFYLSHYGYNAYVRTIPDVKR